VHERVRRVAAERGIALDEHRRAPDADAASAAAIPAGRRRHRDVAAARRASTDEVRGELLAKHLELARLPRVALTHMGVADAGRRDRRARARCPATPAPTARRSRPRSARRRSSEAGQKSPVYAKKNEHSSPPSGRRASVPYSRLGAMRAKSIAATPFSIWPLRIARRRCSLSSPSSASRSSTQVVGTWNQSSDTRVRKIPPSLPFGRRFTGSGTT
jgi:hypothetical protein